MKKVEFLTYIKEKIRVQEKQTEQEKEVLNAYFRGYRDGLNEVSVLFKDPDQETKEDKLEVKPEEEKQAYMERYERILQRAKDAKAAKEIQEPVKPEPVKPEPKPVKKKSKGGRPSKSPEKLALEEKLKARVRKMYNEGMTYSQIKAYTRTDDAFIKSAINVHDAFISSCIPKEEKRGRWPVKEMSDVV